MLQPSGLRGNFTARHAVIRQGKEFRLGTLVMGPRHPTFYPMLSNGCGAGP